MIVTAMPAPSFGIICMHAVTWVGEHILGLQSFPYFASKARFESTCHNTALYPVYPSGRNLVQKSLPSLFLAISTSGQIA